MYEKQGTNRTFNVIEYTVLRLPRFIKLERSVSRALEKRISSGAPIQIPAFFIIISHNMFNFLKYFLKKYRKENGMYKIKKG